MNYVHCTLWFIFRTTYLTHYQRRWDISDCIWVLLKWHWWIGFWYVYMEISLFVLKTVEKYLTATTNLEKHINIQFMSNFNAFLLTFANKIVVSTLWMKTDSNISLSLSFQTLGMKTTSKWYNTIPIWCSLYVHIIVSLQKYYLIMLYTIFLLLLF